ncbi:ankyrin repeat domain-containing protein [Candidatus Dependentiae bacterium]|nr:ankyrin repeat domain-containing protein [Candidatus Dependentiae bacterium]
MLKIYLILSLTIFPSLILSMNSDKMEIIPVEVVDSNKSAEEIFQKLFTRGADTRFGRERILKEIGNELSKTLSKHLERKKRLNNSKELVKIISNFAGNSDVIEALKEIKSDSGETLMHAAALYGDVNAIKILKEAGANVNASAEDGRTPLHDAAWKNNIEAVKILLEYGAKVNVDDVVKTTPLHLAAIAKSNPATILDTVHILLCAGANINARNINRNTPLDLAYASYGSEELKQYLIDRGAKTWRDLP